MINALLNISLIFITSLEDEKDVPEFGGAAIAPPSNLYGAEDGGVGAGLVPDYGTGDDSEYGGAGDAPPDAPAATEFKAPDINPFKPPGDPFKAPEPFKAPAPMAPPPQKLSVTELIKNPTKVVLCLVRFSFFIFIRNQIVRNNLL